MEFQAKELFAKHGVATTLGVVVTTPEDARAAAEQLGPCVVKAQVKAGGRGKAGGVKLAKTPDEAFEHATNILGMEIKGLTVHRVLVTPATPPVEEYYFSFLLDRANRQYLCIASVEGGVEIEEVAKTNPDAVKQIAIDPGAGVDEAKAREIVAEAGLPGRPLRAGRHDGPGAVDRSSSRRTPPWSRSTRSPGSKATGSRRSTARSRSTTTPSSGTRDHAAFEIKDETDPLEAKAKEKGLNYVKLDGEVGIIGNGAGLVMSTLDVVAYAGEAHGGVKPANFLDIGGGANAQVMADGLDVILGDDQVKAVFVNVFGGITACDEVANGIKGALEILGDEATKPLVVRLDGNNVEKGRAILEEAEPPAGHPGRHDGRRGRQGRRAGPRLTTTDATRTTRRTQMSIYLNKDSKIIVQGMTGGMGSKHTTLMLDAGSDHRRRGQRPQGRHHRRARRPGAAGLRQRQGGDGRDRCRRLGGVRAAGVHQGRLHRGHRRRDRPARGDHRGRAGAGHRRGVGLPAEPGQHREHPDDRPQLPGHHHARGVAGRHHARTPSPARARSGWSPSPAR